MGCFEVVLSQRYYNQLVVNRYSYLSSGTPAAVSLSFGLAAAMGWTVQSGIPPLFNTGTIARRLQELASTELFFVSAYVRNLYSVTDFYEVPFANSPHGNVSGDALSPTAALGLTSSRVRTDIRRGSKRLAGVVESSSGAGGAVVSGTLDQLNLLAGLLNDPITYDDEGNTLSYTACVFGLEQYTTPSGKTAYRNYATEAEQLDHVASGMVWQPMPYIRTQTSRQYGRGA